MTTKPVFIGTALVLVAAIGAIAWFVLPSGSELATERNRTAGAPRPVITAVVKKEVFGDHLEAIGTLYANESVTLTAKTQGIIRSIDFEDGQTFKKGEQIAAVDAGAEDAQLRVELANLEQQKKELERANDLAQANHVSQMRVDELVAAVKKAEATVSAASTRVGDRRIIAPFSGIVGTRRISLGALVSPGTAVTTLDDISKVKLDFAIPETFMAALRPGLEIEATASAYPGRVFKGVVTAVDGRVDIATRSITIRAEVPNDELLLRPGMLMVVDLIKDQREALMIPEAALLAENNKQYVYTVSNDVATKVEVQIGRRRSGFVEILKGVNEGDLVVREGTQDLPSGAKVAILRQSAELT